MVGTKVTIVVAACYRRQLHYSLLSAPQEAPMAVTQNDVMVDLPNELAPRHRKIGVTGSHGRGSIAPLRRTTNRKATPPSGD